MDFILRHDWLYRVPVTHNFLTSESLSTCNIQRIISGTFRDPLISDEDSEEDQHHDIDLLLRTSCNNRKTNNQKYKTQKSFIPGLRPEPSYSKLSAIDKECHLAGIRVLAEKDRTINNYYCEQPTDADYKLFQGIKEIYAKEKKEYLEWARGLWLSKHCLLSLKPTPLVEQVYEADWMARVTAASSLPSDYEYAAQITMPSEQTDCQLVHIKNLKEVNVSKVPLVILPSMERYQSIFNMAKEFILQPCKRHPCRIILPDEEKPSSLPMNEIHSVLAKYACDNGATCVVSERALRCLTQPETAWNLPITVETLFKVGGLQTVVVIDSDISPQKQLKRDRTERALHLMLRHTFTRIHSKEELYKDIPTTLQEGSSKKPAQGGVEEDLKKVDLDSDCSSEDEDKMYIHLGEEKAQDMDAQSAQSSKSGSVEGANDAPCSQRKPSQASPRVNTSSVLPDLQLTDCTCQSVSYRGHVYQRSLHMSYKKWELRNKSTQENIPIIVHSSHKYAKDEETEVVVSVVPEHQLELGGAAVSRGKRRAASLGAHLRDKAVVLTSRVDARSGQIVSLEYTERESLEEELMQEAASILCSALSQLRRLKPQRYVLHHEPQHGENALLFVASVGRRASVQPVQRLSIALDHNISQDKEKSSLQIPPVLSDVLLPAHKLRKVLPLAFGYQAVRPVQTPRQTAALRRAKAIELAKKAKNAKKNAEKRKRKKNNNCKTETAHHAAGRGAPEAEGAQWT